MLSKIAHIYRDAFSGLNREVWILCTILTINRAGAMILTFTSLYLKEDLDFSLSQAGTVMAAYGVGSILGAYIGGELADRYGSYMVQVVSLLLSAAILLIFIQLTDFIAIFFCIFIYAVVTDMLRPANSVAMATFSDGHNRTRSFSLMRFSANLGFSIGPAVGGLIAGLAGFKWVFIFDAITCLGAAFLLFRYLRHKYAHKQEIKRNEAVERGASPSAYKDRLYLLFIFMVAVYGTTFFQLFASTPLYWKTTWGWSEEKIGLLLSLNGLFIVLFEMPYMLKAEHFRDLGKWIALGCLMLVISFLTLLIDNGMLIFALAYIVIMSLSEMFAMPFMTKFAISRPQPERRGQYMALYTMAYGVAHALAPFGSLYLAEHLGFPYTYTIILAMCFLLMIGFYWMRSQLYDHKPTTE
jgi:predicted MFS family arabinose efflux permease